ncbi:DUF6417 family protein [Streptomyces fagopyri]|uniref:DUF6417 family protein n=1 Tax=Streptomyces fagopyri TaxID=2662397 RepID=UPI0033DD86A8
MELVPSQMAALRVFIHLADRLRIPPAHGLAEQVRTASCDHGIKRSRLHLTEDQIASVAYGFWLHRMTGSAAEANRFSREYGVSYTPALDGQDRFMLPRSRGPSRVRSDMIRSRGASCLCRS